MHLPHTKPEAKRARVVEFAARQILDSFFTVESGVQLNHSLERFATLLATLPSG
jgi:hypothetical protein